MAELLPVAEEKGGGIIVRVAFDEGSLTGKFTEQTAFAKDDFRSRYFQGDRLPRTVARVEKIKGELGGMSMAEAALVLCTQDPKGISGQIIYSVPFLKEQRRTVMTLDGRQPWKA